MGYRTTKTYMYDYHLFKKNEFITFQRWNTVLYPWNKIDIFTLYFHGENNKSFIFIDENSKSDCCVMFLIMKLCYTNAKRNLLHLKQTKSKEHVINRKFRAFLMNMEFTSFVRQGFALMKILKKKKKKPSYVTRKINFIFIKKHWISTIYYQLA
jgi:hypothetical protein